MKLIIVESPTKSKTIGKILGNKFVIKSTFGHIRDLPKHRLGIDVDNNFAPTYQIDKSKTKLTKELISSMKKAKEIYIATDEDREGEAIGWHVTQLAKLPSENFKRITFHEITPNTIKASFDNIRNINFNLVDAQQARRILDRLVGYTLSPLLSKKIYKGLSAGRVQSVALRIIVDREDEIKAFKPQEYWTIEANVCANEDKKFDIRFWSKQGKKYKKFDLHNKEKVLEIIDGLEKETFQVSSVKKEPRRKFAAAPFITSTMQQVASRSLGFSPKMTMGIAQSLYEGIAISGNETIGLITYMRTDSVSIAESAKQEAVNYIKQTFSEDYIPQKPRIYKSKVKNAQEAHECIRPTSVFKTPESVKQYLNNTQFKLYELIWKRFLASQMKEALIEQLIIEVTAKDTIWRASGQRIVFPGYMKVYNHDLEKDYNKDKLLPELKLNDILKLLKINPKQHYTEPPPRYNEASLINALEEHGIGRPSTYAPIISIILNRKYVKLEDRRFFPEESGITVTKILEKHFPDIVNLDFTAKMEKDLDKISLGEIKWQSMLKEFYTPFIKQIHQAEINIKSQKVSIETDKKCPLCTGTFLIKKSRYGKFLACSNFPKCRHTESLEEENISKTIDEKCPSCGNPLIIKKGRFGSFIGCSNYPKCKYIRSMEQVKMNCTECGKPMVVKFSKRGKFLACSSYPECKHTESLPKKKKSNSEE